MRRILVVEDDEQVRRALCQRLASHGHDVLSAIDAVSAVSVAIECLPEVIVLDVQLPGGDGFIVAERLREEPSTTDIPLIFITAGRQPWRRRRAAELSCVAFLEKPFEAALLLDAIDLATVRQTPSLVRRRHA